MSEKIVAWNQITLLDPAVEVEMGEHFAVMARRAFNIKYPGVAITAEGWITQAAYTIPGEDGEPDIEVPQTWLRYVEGKADTATCASCGEEYVVRPPAEASDLRASGWCMPTEAMYDMADREMFKQCPDCHSRYLMVLLIGIDPGPKGANLRVPRGGITYPTDPTWKD